MARLHLALAMLACIACRPGELDVAMCILPAEDRIVVRVSAACASDHEGAKLSCEIDREGSDLHVKTSGRDGRDPDGSCADDLVATCETEPLPAGMYTVHFEDDTHEVEVPSEGDEFCGTGTE
jgi:hypothetical protein